MFLGFFRDTMCLLCDSGMARIIVLWSYSV